VLKALAEGKEPKTGPQSARKGSEPDGPLTSLTEEVRFLAFDRWAEQSSRRAYAVGLISFAATNNRSVLPSRVALDVWVGAGGLARERNRAALRPGLETLRRSHKWGEPFLCSGPAWTKRFARNHSAIYVFPALPSQAD
jgi:hypothetical protein